MKNIKFTFGLLAIVTLCLSQSCTDVETANPEKSRAMPVVFVPISPYEFVFERIAGDLVDVRVIVGPGEDPHSYLPTPKQVVEISEANLLCAGELGFEGNFFIKEGDGTNGPKHVNLLKNLDLLEGHCDHPSHLTEHSEDGHGHSEHHEHEHKEDGHGHDKKGEDEHDDHHGHHDHEDLNDPHVWLSPSALKVQADYIATELKTLLPEDKSAEIDENVAAFKAELTGLHEELSETLRPHKGRKFYVYHGAFAYFAKDFGLEQIAVEDGNKSPTPSHVATMVKQAKADGVKLVFIQPQFNQAGAKALAEAIDGRVVTLDPLEKDIFTNLRRIAKAVTGEEGN
ncbi:MAG: zinc ABC transporter solute-binding protein [Verrucomicrobiales bacterium]|nr:zinc ABC transporter solute-binding protein [Verrucomicrobiales bacterium]